MDVSRSQYRWLTTWARKRLPRRVAHQATRFEHFTCQPQSFASQLYKVAAELGLKVTVAVFPDHGIVLFRFYGEDDDSTPRLAVYPLIRKLRGESS